MIRWFSELLRWDPVKAHIVWTPFGDFDWVSEQSVETLRAKWLSLRLASRFFGALGIDHPKSSSRHFIFVDVKGSWA